MLELNLRKMEIFYLSFRTNVRAFTSSVADSSPSKKLLKSLVRAYLRPAIRHCPDGEGS